MAGVLGSLASAAAPYLVDQVAGMFTAGGQVPTYGTAQADAAMRSNTGYTGGKTREQLEYEERLRRDGVLYDQGLAQQNVDFLAGRTNAASNANTARNMAYEAQRALNDVYMNAGNRLNTARNNTMSAINDAGRTAVSMFR